MNSPLVVVSRYDENIDWVDRLNCDFLIYNKGESLNRQSITLKNIGREAETFLRYIISNYHSLPSAIAFVQGNPFDHCRNIIEKINGYEQNDGIIPLGDKIFRVKTCQQFFMGEIFNDLFGYLPSENSSFAFCAGAQHIVSKSHILNKSIDWWINAYMIYNSYNDSPVISKHIGHVFERLWPYIFSYKNDNN